MDSCLPVGYRIYSHCAGMIGIGANVLLIYLIVSSKGPAEMRSFNRMLLFRSSMDSLEVLLMWVLEPHTELRPEIGLSMIFNGGYVGKSPATLVVFAAVYIFSIFMQFYNTAVLFCYRYVTLRSHEQRRNVILAVVTIEMVLLVVLVLVVLYFALKNLHLTATIDGICKGHEILLTTVDDLTSMRVPLALFYVMLSMLANYGGMIWCSHATSTFMKRATYASARTVALQRQLFYVLLFEALGPLVLVMTPILALFSILLFDPTNTSVQEMTQMTTCAIVLRPVISPIFTTFFVKAYRRRLLEHFSRTISYFSHFSSSSSTYQVHSGVIQQF